MKFSALVAALLALTLVACGEKAAVAPVETAPVVEAAPAVAPATEAAPAAAPADATTAAPAVAAPAAK